MTALYPQNLFAYSDVFFVFLRLIAFFILAPAFSHTAIPATVKTLLALTLALALYPVAKPYLSAIPPTLDGIVLVALRETAVGLLLGFVALLTFESIHLASQFIGYQMGFGTAGLVDPQNQAHVSVLVPFQGWILLMVFFFCDMHHRLIETFVYSFQVTRGAAEGVSVSLPLYQAVVEQTGGLFVLAIQLAAPFTFLVLATNVGIGVLSRFLPQMNIMLFSFPITIMLSFAALYLLAPELMSLFEVKLSEMAERMIQTLRLL